MNRVVPLMVQHPTPPPIPRHDPKVVWRLFKGFSGLILIAILVGGAQWLLRLESEYLPVRVVSIEGEVRQMTLQQIQDRVGQTLDAGILTQDLAAIQAAIKELPWVSSAGVRRAWPDRLVISVREHKPLARWGDDGLVTAEGRVFRPDRHEIPHGLPRLAGPDDQGPQVVARFQAWQPLLKSQGLSILALEDDPRGAWTLTTDAGFNLLLGKTEVDSRLERFLRAYPHILAAGRPARVDMRYSNGLAVSWSGARLARAADSSSGWFVQTAPAGQSSGITPDPTPIPHLRPPVEIRRSSRS
ncbi:MAG: cell division protein FtsQ/DivIB [Chromatiaceae bacterium]|nr:cell division protein FtsQ/DivIB [Chromatiaceae bacterium]